MKKSTKSGVFIILLTGSILLAIHVIHQDKLVEAPALGNDPLMPIKKPNAPPMLKTVAEQQARDKANQQLQLQHKVSGDLTAAELSAIQQQLAQKQNELNQLHANYNDDSLSEVERQKIKTQIQYISQQYNLLLTPVVIAKLQQINGDKLTTGDD